MKNRGFAARLRFAASGVALVFRREKSFKSQSALGLAAGLGLLLLRPGFAWSALILFCCALVLALEAVNAALEYVLDHLHPHFAAEIGAAKDAAAGAVLLVSLASLGVAALMLLDLYSGG